ncbi:F-type ATPase subunit delta [Hartmannibacter diazotrophicus]|uniref:ATP synthase subunit delta n=1 Tax=Hartmannibacter diazotrophicus TaxID=1482074 RepID=A0A2C9DBG8_9HYPH|nr:F0F1 ATP synthase subunit delta [Hartmannibacter diazotrophicus]SON57519.1 F-type ATPase subunit delta [Hartmannibacter diazotrophicus]
MSETADAVSGVAERYATALFDLALEAGALDQVSGDIASFEALLKESDDLKRLVLSPVFSADDQLKAITAILDRAGLGGLVGNIVKLAARNRRLFAIEGIFKGYRALLAAHRGEITADVVSATPLNDVQVAELKDTLSAMAGKQVIINASVDPSLIGGLIVRMGSRMIDNSLKTKLNALKIALKEVG